MTSPHCPQTYFVDQSGLKLRGPPTFQMLRLKARATIAQFWEAFKNYFILFYMSVCA